MSIAPQQIKMIESWTEQRDTLLREVGVYQTELDTLRNATKEAGLNFDDLQRSIAEAKGRLSEIEEKENRFRNSLATDVSELIAQKSRLESEIETKKAELKGIEEKKVEVIASIDTLTLMHDRVFTRSSGLDSIAGQVEEVSKENITEIKNLATNLKEVFEEMIGRGTENVKQTNIILEKLPRYIFELQKPIPVRRIPGKGSIQSTNLNQQ